MNTVEVLERAREWRDANVGSDLGDTLQDLIVLAKQRTELLKARAEDADRWGRLAATLRVLNRAFKTTELDAAERLCKEFQKEVRSETAKIMEVS